SPLFIKCSLKRSPFNYETFVTDNSTTSYMGLESVPFGVRPKALFPEAKRSLCFTGQSLRFIQTKALFLFIGNAVLV
ncbi:hypothetical protein, partial [Bacteroides pyogenes]|uniref:hypothetical protein n=1 Tax=Bacteroides pyogenes TaxID=310300 RepID=UPI001BA993A1